MNLKSQKYVIVGIILTLITLILFNKIETAFLSVSKQWTISKLLPYLLLIISGILLFIFSFRTFKNKVIKVSISFSLLIAPFSIGFGLHPIYQGDFSKSGKEIHSKTYSEHHIRNGLYVITIPGCPYCFESISRLKQIKNLHPNLQIELAVSTTDSTLIETYQIESENLFHVKTTKNPNKIASLADHRFPAFVLIKNNKAAYKWDNSQFGVRAIDEITK